MKRILLTFLTLSLVVVSHPSISQTSTSAKSASLERADSLFFLGQWDKARGIYEVNAREHAEKFKALTWNRLGYCYHNLGKYADALKNYRKAMEAGPPAPLKPFLTSRMARSYSMQLNKDEAFRWLDSAAQAGYSNLSELDSLPDFKPLRADSRFVAFRKRVFDAAFPCSSDSKNRAFDFWIGVWDVYQTGTTAPLVGHSVIQNISGGCAILENWTSNVSGYEGKSINYFDKSAGKWEQDWMGSDGGATRFINGEYKDDAMRFTFEAALPNGQKAMGRFIFYNQGPNQVRQFSEQSVNGTDWQTNYDFTYVRRKKAQAH